MEKTPIIFEPQRIAEGDWQIRVHCPGAELKYINLGFKTRAEVDEWLAKGLQHEWLKSQGLE
jgi:hypothetical protein